MRQQILDIQDASDIINRILVDGDAGVVILNDTLKHLRERGSEVEINDILTRGHHLLSSLVAETNDTFQHILLFLKFFFVGKLECLLQIINTEHMVLLLHHLLCKHARSDEDISHRTEQFAQPKDTWCRHPTESQRMLPGIDLWHNLTKEQQQERQQNSNHHKLQPVSRTESEYLCEEIVAEHDDRDVHQIVGNQDGGQRTL